MPAPDVEIFAGLDSLGARIRRLAHEAGVFLERAAPWYRMWLREPMLTGPWAEAGAEAGSRWETLFRTALGPLADDADAMAVVRASMEPAFFEAVRAGNRSTEATADLIAAAITPWLERQAGDVRSED
jgi:hypothetical protein